MNPPQARAFYNTRRCEPYKPVQRDTRTEACQDMVQLRGAPQQAALHSRGAAPAALAAFATPLSHTHRRLGGPGPAPSGSCANFFFPQKHLLWQMQKIDSRVCTPQRRDPGAPATWPGPPHARGRAHRRRASQPGPVAARAEVLQGSCRVGPGWARDPNGRRRRLLPSVGSEAYSGLYRLIGV